MSVSVEELAGELAAAVRSGRVSEADAALMGRASIRVKRAEEGKIHLHRDSPCVQGRAIETGRLTHINFGLELGELMEHPEMCEECRSHPRGVAGNYEGNPERLHSWWLGARVLSGSLEIGTREWERAVRRWLGEEGVVALEGQPSFVVERERVWESARQGQREGIEALLGSVAEAERSAREIEAGAVGCAPEELDSMMMCALVVDLDRVRALALWRALRARMIESEVGERGVCAPAWMIQAGLREGLGVEDFAMGERSAEVLRCALALRAETGIGSGVLASLAGALRVARASVAQAREGGERSGVADGPQGAC